MAAKQLDNDRPVDMAGPAQDVAGPSPSTVENPPEQETRHARTAGDESCADDPADDPADDRADDTMTPPHGDTLAPKI